MLDKFLTDAQVREMFGDICTMTLHRWRHAEPPKIPFPQPIRINGRNYNSAYRIADYVQALAEANTPVRDIPKADEGRAMGREKLSSINAAKKAPPKPIDHLGHNGGPPLDDAVEQGDLPVIKVGEKMRVGKNG